MACLPLEGGMATAFSGCLLTLLLTLDSFPACRLALAHIVERTLALADYLSEGGAVKSFNVDNLLLRESMDVIGAPLCP